MARRAGAQLAITATTASPTPTQAYVVRFVASTPKRSPASRRVEASDTALPQGDGENALCPPLEQHHVAPPALARLLARCLRRVRSGDRRRKLDQHRIRSFDVMYVDDRYRMAANEFAVSRSAVMSSRIAGPIHEQPVLRLRPRAKRRRTTPATMAPPDCG